VIAFSPEIAIRDSDEITAVRLVPQLVLLKTTQRGTPPYAPSEGVLRSEDTDGESGYKPRTTKGPRSPRSHRRNGGSSSLGGPSVAFRFDPSGDTKLTQRPAPHKPSSLAR
jgi:hypothetical protein